MPNEGESAVVKWMFAEAANGLGYRTKVSVALRTGNKRGGNSWTAQQVVATLRNPVHIGMLRDGDGARLGCHEAIIGDAVFARVAEVLDGRRTRRPGAFVYGPIWPLKRKITCGTCGYQIAAGTIESAVVDLLPCAQLDELDSHRIRTHVESVLYDNETWTVTVRLVPRDDKTVAIPLGPPDEFSNSGSQ